MQPSSQFNTKCIDTNPCQNSSVPLLGQNLQCQRKYFKKRPDEGGPWEMDE